MISNFSYLLGDSNFYKATWRCHGYKVTEWEGLLWLEVTMEGCGGAVQSLD